MTVTKPTPRAYYNENDRFTAAWLRELIKAGHIAPGDVDDRSIKDVQPGDLQGYTQCHFFAGIGGWSYALRLAGWPDDRPVWTGSCPCPSFSSAGKGLGFADPRHLWPAWFRLIRECRPSVVFGEQVAAAIGHGWLDLVSGDLEAEGYAVGACVLGAHSVGAPHIRQRLYFGADAKYPKRRPEHEEYGSTYGRHGLGGSSEFIGSADAKCDGGRADIAERQVQGGTADGRDRASGIGPYLPGAGRGARRPEYAEQCGESGASGHGSSCQRGDAELLRCNAAECGDSGGQETARGASGNELARSCGTGNSHDVGIARLEGHAGNGCACCEPRRFDPNTARSIAAAGATRGFWGDCDWWYGRDGKYRPIEPGLQPLAHGVPNRVGRLRGYGNAIVPQLASEFIQAYIEARNGL